MTDYIERSKAIEDIQAWATAITNPKFLVRDDAVCVLENIPSADVAPVRHGWWVDTQPDIPNWSYAKNGMSHYCSACLHPAGKFKHKTYKYCPWCGAKMDGDSK